MIHKPLLVYVDVNIRLKLLKKRKYYCDETYYYNKRTTFSSQLSS